MCGICGFYNVVESSESRNTLKKMTATLAHRGPDGMATWLHPTGRVGFGHTRLAIIDLAGGNQPMTSEDGRFVIVFNGEIYNYRRLRHELESYGHQFRTKSDTEVLLNAYRQWGRECLARLSGMFAFAVYDEHTHTLFLARDRTGIKPLYYAAESKGFFFGSELKAILGTGSIAPRVDFRALADFFVLGYPLLPATFFKGCRELEPGTWLEVTRERISAGRYWSWARSEEAWSEATAVERTEHALRESLAEHLNSDVPLGAFLSGGIDSSVLVALLAQSSGAKLKTFTVKFGEAAYDESTFARAVAERFNTSHHEIELDAANADLALVGDVLDGFDQPFGDSSAIPTYMICREIRKHVKVVLGGDGGDEMFGGYPRFRYADIAKTLGGTPRWLRDGASWFSTAFKPLGTTRSRQMHKLLRAAERQDAHRLLALSCYTFPENLADVFVPVVLENIADYYPSLAETTVNDPGGAELIDATVRYALPGDYLRKVDCMSSAHGLEVRVPFLGAQVLDCAARVPHRLKYSANNNKIILRKLARKYLPEAVACKPKGGFGIPLDTWLGEKGRRELHDMLCSNSARLRELIRPKYLSDTLDSFLSTKRDDAKQSRYNLYQQVYFLWGLERWLTRWRPAY